MNRFKSLVVSAGLLLLVSLLPAVPALAEDSKLAARAAKVRPDTGAPALGIVIASVDGAPEIAVDGVRVLDKADKVTANDRWHIGSMAKSMTATMIARLIEQGLLKFDSTLGELLPDIDMKPEYKAITLEQVMHHRAGLQPLLRPEPALTKLVNETQGSQIDKNAAFTRWLLTQEPIVPPGTAMKYSNGGYALVGHIAERLTKLDYRTLMQREVFTPLGMSTAGFGWPIDLGPEQPRGHFPAPNGVVPAPEGYRRARTASSRPRRFSACTNPPQPPPVNCNMPADGAWRLCPWWAPGTATTARPAASSRKWRWCPSAIWLWPSSPMPGPSRARVRRPRPR
ncbi:MAG: beta-lactamase family protein [Betaproteobacteria bacterium]|nr:beta-lactamase family protein [Betaproteobacteria bacterium]